MASTLIWKGPLAIKVGRTAMAKALTQAAAVIQTEAKEQLSRQGRGRLHPGLKHRSSAPGDPPAVQTGALRNSVVIDKARVKDLRNPQASVGTGLVFDNGNNQGATLEFGTRHIAPRPWMRPAFIAGQKKALRVANNIIEKAWRSVHT